MQEKMQCKSTIKKVHTHPQFHIAFPWQLKMHQTDYTIWCILEAWANLKTAKMQYKKTMQRLIYTSNFTVGFHSLYISLWPLTSGHRSPRKHVNQRRYFMKQYRLPTQSKMCELLVPLL